MEVLTVNNVDPNIKHSGGVEVYVTSLAYLLSKHGINITLVGVSHNKKRLSFDYPFTFIPVVKSNRFISGYKFLFNLLLKALTLKISNTAIIHTHRPDDLLPFVLFYQKNPKICTLHGLHINTVYVNKGKFVGKIYELISKFTLKRVDKIIVVDERTKEFYLQKYPWLKDKIIVIPVGIDTSKFKPMDRLKMRKKYGFKKGDKIILYVGRLEKEKNLDLLLKIFKEMENEIENVQLVLVGDGREKEYLKSLAKELELKNVIFMHPVEHEKIPEIMNCADVFVLSSLYEGMPTVVLESLACGVPVVSTDVGDVHKVVKDGKTGYIIKTRNQKEIKTKIINALAENDKFKENCIKIAQEYSWDKIIEKLEGCLNELIEKN